MKFEYLESRSSHLQVIQGEVALLEVADDGFKVLRVPEEIYEAEGH